MIRNSLAFASLLVLFCLLHTSCKKINEATELGGNLIPAVDNVTTFDTTLSVETFNGLFTNTDDSTRSTSSDQQFVGSINDALFGKTDGTIFFQLQPTLYPFSFGYKKDSLIALDSVVLVLGVNSVYGDSLQPVKLNVSEMALTNTFRYDSSYLISKNNFTIGSSIAPTATIFPYLLNDSTFPKKEAAANQLRIKLDNSFGQKFLNLDSATYYTSDSAFRDAFRGFAVAPASAGAGNALIGINLSDTNTKLAFYYRYKNNGAIIDTVNYFKTNATSASANYINRNYTGSQLASFQGGTTPDNLVFIQNTPGSYATINVPGLASLSNRVIHRAELIAEQVYNSPTDDLLTPPTYLYLDAYDSTNSKYETIPYDAAYAVTVQVPYYQISNLEDFGMIGKQSVDNSGHNVYKWHFNLTRYVQHVVTKKEKATSLRLYSPFIIKNELYPTTTEGFIFSNPSYGVGQVRLGGGNHAQQPMRLYIIYSKL